MRHDVVEGWQIELGGRVEIDRAKVSVGNRGFGGEALGAFDVFGNRGGYAVGAPEIAPSEASPPISATWSSHAGATSRAKLRTYGIC
jgi:hypothetical protein